MNSLRRRLTCFLAVGSGAVLMAVLAAVYPAARHWLTAGFDAALLAKVRALTALPEPGRSGINLAFTERIPPEYQAGGAEYFQVWLAADVVQARSPSLGTNSLPLRAGLESRPEHWALTLPDGRKGRAVGLSFSLGSDAQANSWDFAVVFARDTTGLQRTLRGLLWSLIAGGVALTALMILVSGRAIRAALRPMETLAREVTGIDAASLSKRFDAEHAPEEMQPVMRQLNQLLERLEAAFAREQRFAASAAHELLTPVSELRALAEAAEKWRDDPAATAGFSADVRETAMQMEQMIRALLALARAEPNGAEAERMPVDISALLEGLRPRAENNLQARKLTLGWRVTPGIVALGDVAAGRAILTNLLDNAIEHTPHGGRVECLLRVDGNKFAFTLVNTNPGLTPTDLPHLFEPFWRKDAARSDRTHTGLGLALARAFAGRLGWELSIRLAEPKTIEVRLRGPAVSTS